jgi:hypothetical protein
MVNRILLKNAAAVGAMLLLAVTAIAAVNWSLSRNGAIVSIDSAGKITLSPKAGQPVSVPTGKTAVVADADALTVGGVIVPQAIEVTYRCQAAATCVTAHFFNANAAYQVTAVRAVWGTAESTATNLRLQVEKLTGTTAAGSGTALLTDNSNAGISIKGTANTVTAGTLTGTAGSKQLAAGDRLGVKFETAPTEGSTVVLTVTLKRI